MAQVKAETKTEEIKKQGTAASETIRPTKKQRELLTFIEEFIAAKGYSPSYREIMQGQQYTSVATVSLHINSLIKRGHLRKRDRSARSLEVVKPSLPIPAKVVPKQLKASEEKWLVEKVETFFKEAEGAPKALDQQLDQLYVLVGALKVLGLEGAAQSFIARLSDIKKQQKDTEYAV
jgi:SOS-response transcriptional repressor LexA